MNNRIPELNRAVEGKNNMSKSKRKQPHRKEKKTRLAQNRITPTEVSRSSTTNGQVKAVSPGTGIKASLANLTGAARHPYVSGELKRIAILTAILFVILVILAFALPRFI